MTRPLRPLTNKFVVVNAVLLCSSFDAAAVAHGPHAGMRYPFRSRTLNEGELRACPTRPLTAHHK
eukprot:5759586-Pyramimonas_sp.AAC.1